MRFTCPKCGKKYASSAEPAPGKAYRLKCKACGEQIVLRAGGAVAPEGGVQASAAPAATPPPTLAPASAMAQAQPAAGAAAEAAIPIPTATPSPAAAAPPPLVPPPSDESLDLDALMAETGPSPEGPLSASDPFAAAARSSLPDTYGAAGGGAAPDPLAALAREPTAPQRRQVAPPKFSTIPRPPRQRAGSTFVLLAIGVAFLLAVLVFTVVRGNRAPAPADPGPAPASAAQRPAGG